MSQTTKWCKPHVDTLNVISSLLLTMVCMPDTLCLDCTLTLCGTSYTLVIQQTMAWDKTSSSRSLCSKAWLLVCIPSVSLAPIVGVAPMFDTWPSCFFLCYHQFNLLGQCWRIQCYHCVCVLSCRLLAFSWRPNYAVCMQMRHQVSYRDMWHVLLSHNLKKIAMSRILNYVLNHRHFYITRFF